MITQTKAYHTKSSQLLFKTVHCALHIGLTFYILERSLNVGILKASTNLSLLKKALIVQVINEVGGENDDTREPFNVVEKNTNINVGIAVG